MDSSAAKADTKRIEPASESQARIGVSATVTPEVEFLSQTKSGSRWATFHHVRYRFRGRAGAWIDGEREFLDRGDSVALLPYCPETGHILLTRQFRMPVYLRHPQDAMLLEVCGGILDHTDPETTLRHEALDELGVELQDVEHVFSAYSTPGSVCEKIHFYVARYSTEQRRSSGGGLQHEGEDIEVLEVPLSDALTMIREGLIRDLRTVSLVLFLVVGPTAEILGSQRDVAAT